MEIDELQTLAGNLSGVTFDVKWDHILTCLVGNKMFCNFDLNALPIHCSIKMSPENYQFYKEQEGFRPSPYLARYNWVQLTNLALWNQSEWKNSLREAYQLTFDKLPKKTQLLLIESTQIK